MSRKGYVKAPGRVQIFVALCCLSPKCKYKFCSFVLLTRLSCSCLFFLCFTIFCDSPERLCFFSPHHFVVILLLRGP